MWVMSDSASCGVWSNRWTSQFYWVCINLQKLFLEGGQADNHLRYSRAVPDYDEHRQFGFFHRVLDGQLISHDRDEIANKFVNKEFWLRLAKSKPGFSHVRMENITQLTHSSSSRILLLRCRSNFTVAHRFSFCIYFFYSFCYRGAPHSAKCHKISTKGFCFRMPTRENFYLGLYSLACSKLNSRWSVQIRKR